MLEIASGIDMDGNLQEIKQRGYRPVGSLVLFKFLGNTYSINFIRYQNMWNENRMGRWN